MHSSIGEINPLNRTELNPPFLMAGGAEVPSLSRKGQ